MRSLQEKSASPETVGHASRESDPFLPSQGLGDWENCFAYFDLYLEVGEVEKEYQKECPLAFRGCSIVDLLMTIED